MFTLARRREIKKIARSKPAEHGLPFSRWSLAKLADFLVAEGVVEDISHEGLRELLCAGVRHLFAALELGSDTMHGHIKKRKRRGEFLQFCRYLRSLHPPQVRIAVVCDNFSPHLTTRKDKRVGQRAAASNTEIACTPANSSWMNRLECQFTALREFTLNGTDHATHREQGSMIRRYIAWRNRPTRDPRLRRIVKRAGAA